MIHSDGTSVSFEDGDRHGVALLMTAAGPNTAASHRSGPSLDGIAPADDGHGLVATITVSSKQRLSPSALPPKLIGCVAKGMLAVDSMPTRGQRQILDFLVAGDVVAASIGQTNALVSFRAVTNAVVHQFDRTDDTGSNGVLQTRRWFHLFNRLQHQLARSNAQQMMLGHLDAEARVASFLLSLALRSGELKQGYELPIPMTRDDVADHLALNHDTLSRIWVRFEKQNWVVRRGRHAVQLLDIEAIKRATPLASMLIGLHGSRFAETVA